MTLEDKKARLYEALSSTGAPSKSLASLDVLLALYNNVLCIMPDQPSLSWRDRVYVSHGPLCPAFLSVLAERGYFPADTLTAESLSDASSLPGAEGICAKASEEAVKDALACAANGADYRVFALLLDDECEKGHLWESALKASANDLGKLCFILFHERLRGRAAGPGSICSKFAAFGFATCTVDSSDMASLILALNALMGRDKPVFLCCEI